MTDHAEPREPETAAEDAHLLQRRGLLAGGAVAAAAAVAALATAQRADAAHDTGVTYDTQTAMHVDVTNTTAGSTRISSDISGTAAFVALNNYPVGISRPDGMLGRTSYITSNCAGVAGACEAASGGLGVMGTAKASDGTGVYGYAGSSVPSTVAPAGTGVYGSGPNYGMYAVARAAAGVGVHGESTAGVAVQGTATGGNAVEGTSNTGSGIKGQSTAANGVHGISAAGTGVRGETTSGVGVLGTADATGIAGKFVGRTVVEGALATAALDASGPVHLANTLDVTGQATVAGLNITGAATVAGLNVAGPATFVGEVTLPAAAKLDKLALPKTSGIVTLGKAAASVAVANAPVAAGTLVVATLQKHVKGLWIEAAVPAIAGKKISIHFNKRAPKGTKVAWMLVN
jgi:hypothetical protein